MPIKNDPNQSDTERLKSIDSAHIWIIKNTLPKSSNPLIKDIIGRYIPGEINILKDAKGKPYSEHPSTLHLSIAHSGSYLVLALSFVAAVGVDIELIKPRSQWLRISQRYSFKSSSLLAFYRDWTAREAFAKNVGVGVWASFNSIQTREDEEHYRIGFEKLSHEIDFQEIDNHIVALCVESPTNKYLKYFSI